jgi:hypothetical protein
MTGQDRLKAGIFLLYVLVSALVGEFFPFSRFDMFASAQKTMSSLVTLAGGRTVEPGDYEAFQGAFEPASTEHLQPLMEREFRRLVASRSASGAAGGDVEFEARVCTSTVDRSGAALECRPFWRGRARRR